jgi:hypothetical protein
MLRNDMFVAQRRTCRRFACCALTGAPSARGVMNSARLLSSLRRHCCNEMQLFQSGRSGHMLTAVIRKITTPCHSRVVRC